MSDAKRNARKRINFEDVGLALTKNIGEKGTLMITDGVSMDNLEELEQVNMGNVLDKNKRQKSNSGNLATSNSVSAGSLEGHRQEQ
jgi:hypothetical protein